MHCRSQQTFTHPSSRLDCNRRFVGVSPNSRIFHLILPSDLFRRTGVIFDPVFVAVCLKRHVWVNLLNPTGHVMHQQFNIQQLYVLPTQYLCVLYLSENKQRLVPLTP